MLSLGLDGDYNVFSEASIPLVSCAAFAQALITLGSPIAQAAQALITLPHVLPGASPSTPGRSLRTP